MNTSWFYVFIMFGFSLAVWQRFQSLVIPAVLMFLFVFMFPEAIPPVADVVIKMAIGLVMAKILYDLAAPKKVR